MFRKSRLISLGLILFVVSCAQASSSPVQSGANVTAANQSVLSLGSGKIATSDIPVFAGDSEEIGRASGLLYRAEIKTMLQDWLMPKLRAIPGLTDAFAFSKLTNMVPYLGDDFRAEIDALAQASGQEPRLVALAAAAVDVIELMLHPAACTGAAVNPSRTTTSGMLVGRNLDFATSEITRGYWRPMIFAKTGKLKVLSIGIPGFVGVLTGINEKGVMISLMASLGWDATSYGTPQTITVRRVLEEASSTEEAVKLFVQAERTIPINLLITDGRKAVVLEVSANHHAVRSADSTGFVYTANTFEEWTMPGYGVGRDSRWSIFKGWERERDTFSFDDVRNLTGQVAGIDATGLFNVLAVLVDYSKNKMWFGTDPKVGGRSIYGPLREIDLATVFR